MRNIVHVSEATGWTGGLARLLELAAGLKKRGWTQWIACRENSDLVPKAKALGIDLLPLNLRQDYDFLSAWKLARFVADKDIALVHAHHPRAHAVSLMSKILSKTFVPAAKPPILLVSRRVSFSVGNNPFSQWKYRSGQIDGYVAVAESVKKIMAGSGVPEDKIHVVRSGVDFEAFAARPPEEALRKELGIPANRKVVVKIANASPWKGQNIFLDAARLLTDQGHDFHFLMAGRDTDSPQMREDISKRDLKDRVTCAGFRKDIPRLLSLVDVSVNAAISGEGLSGALRESLAMKIPVIATNTAGNRELVEDGVTGLLCPPGNAQQLADKIKWMLADTQRAAKTAETGYAVVRKEFGVEKAVEDTHALYESLVKSI